jgi:hypothetical protein
MLPKMCRPRCVVGGSDRAAIHWIAIWQGERLAQVVAPNRVVGRVDDAVVVAVTGDPRCYVWKPSTLKGSTPAMADGVTSHLWKFENRFDEVSARYLS